jgi:hypothetical protein
MLFEKETFDRDREIMEDSRDLDHVFTNYTYLIRKYEDMRDAMTPLRAGDRVRLTKSFEPKSNDESPGWWVYRGCLREGRLATVLELSWNPYSHSLQAAIQLDICTWMDDEGTEHPVDESDDKIFYWTAADLEKEKP